MNRLSSLWASIPFLRPEDLAFADLLHRIDPSANASVLLAGALVFHAVGEGEACLDLTQVANKTLREWRGDSIEEIPLPEPSFRFPPLDPWREALLSSSTVAGDQGEKTLRRPLVLDPSHRLYLYRYHRFEWQIASAVHRRCQERIGLSREESHSLHSLLEEGFGPDADCEKIASYLALSRRFLILTGGPGTGKTTTSVRLAAILLTLQPDLRIAFAAPTGKAAHRMTECLQEAKQKIPDLWEGKHRLPDAAQTLHRLLGASHDGRFFRWHRENPLPLDAVIVDETSMVSLPLMAALLEALRPDCRLILLGDKDQLASVEPGSVFADLCAALRERRGSPSFSEHGDEGEAFFGKSLISASPERRVWECLVSLTPSRRFPPDHPVAQLSQAILEARNEEDANRSFSFLRELSEKKESGIHWYDLPEEASLYTEEGRPKEIFRSLIVEGYQPLCVADSIEQALAALPCFRILCVLHKGRVGVEAMNTFVCSVLGDDASYSDSPLSKRKGTRCRFTPILILQNDYSLGLFNGDLGILAWEGRRERAYFEKEGRIGVFPVEVLPSWQVAFATTVHKAQGSEVENLLFLLPPPTPIATKELLYTALTRIKPDPRRPTTTGQIHLVANYASWRAAILTAFRRASGLRDKISSFSPQG